jgi:hypothetical protein
VKDETSTGEGTWFDVVVSMAEKQQERSGTRRDIRSFLYMALTHKVIQIRESNHICVLGCTDASEKITRRRKPRAMFIRMAGKARKNRSDEVVARMWTRRQLPPRIYPVAAHVDAELARRNYGV